MNCVKGFMVTVSLKKGFHLHLTRQMKNRSCILKSKGKGEGKVVRVRN
jgi:hypothetical protein